MQWPEDGESMAANDAIRLTNDCSGIVLEEIEVLVDGVPAELASTQRGPLGGFEVLPAPEVGATVELRACPGYGSCEELEDVDWDTSDAIVEYSFTVGEADEKAPPRPSIEQAGFELIDVDVYDDLCGGEATGTRPAQDWTLQLSNDPETADQALAYVVTVTPADGRDPTVKHHYVRQGGDDVEISVRRFYDTDEPGQDICVSVQAVDMAGNESTADTWCKFFEGGGPHHDEELFEDGEHIVEDDALESCACTTGSSPRGAAGMMLGLLGLLGLRRRRQR